MTEQRRFYICRYPDDSGKPVITGNAEQAIVSAANGRTNVEAYIVHPPDEEGGFDTVMPIGLLETFDPDGDE